MPKVYFLKHIVSRPLLHAGRIVPFVPFGDDTGGIILDDVQSKGLVDALKSMNGTRGVKLVTPEVYEETKKNCNVRASLRSSRRAPEMRVSNPQILQPRAAAGVVESDPLEIPSEIPPPRNKPGPKPGRKRALPTESLAPVPAAAEAVA